MAYTDTPEYPFLLAPSTKGLFEYPELEIDFDDWTSVKRCMDIKFYIDHHIAVADDHTTFASTKDYLNWIFSRKSPFAQKLMVSLLVRKNEQFRPGTANKVGKSHRYQILHDVFNQFTSDLDKALNSGKFNKKLATYKQAHFRKNDKLWFREIKRREKEKSNNNQQQAIDCTFSLRPEESSLNEFWRRTLGIYRITYFNELKGRQPFIYNDTGFRRTHPIQSMKREAQELLFRNSVYTNDYDGKTFAISSLISLNERELGLDAEATYPTLFDYMANRKQYRAKYAEFFQVEEEKGKKIFAHLINKGIISKSSYSSWKKLIDDTLTCAKTKEARKDEWLMAFYNEIKLMWAHCIKSAKKMYAENRLPFKVTNKNRFDLYFFLERQIMDVCTDYMDQLKINYFVIHDGFRTDKKISTKELEQEIYSKLNLVIEIEEK